MSGDSPNSDLVEWAEVATSSRVVSIEREFAGGSRPLWYLKFADHEECVLRLDTGIGALSGSIYSIEREVDVYRALEGSDVPVPRVLAARPTDEGFVILMNRIPGGSRFPRDDNAAISVMVESLVAAIANLHALKASQLGLPWGAAESIRSAVLSEIDQWSILAAPSNDPVCVFALAWLREELNSLNGMDQAASLVQGDTGPGNAVFDGPGLTALVDWELSHLGDPMEDVAWIINRCRQFGGALADGTAVREMYQRLSGKSCDDSRIAYQLVFVYLKCAVITARTIAEGGGALGLNPYQVARQRFRREVLESIATADGIKIESANAIEARVAGELGIAQGLIDQWISELPRPAVSSSAAKLSARDANLGEVHQRMVTQYGVQVDRAIRALDLTSIDGLVHLVAYESVLWPDVSRR